MSPFIDSLTAIGLAFAVLGLGLDLLLWQGWFLGVEEPRCDLMALAARLLGWSGLVAALITAFSFPTGFAWKEAAQFLSLVLPLAFIAVVLIMGLFRNKAEDK